MSRLDYRRKKRRELERQASGKAGFTGFLKRHIGLVALSAVVILIGAAALIVGLSPSFGGSLFGRENTALFLDENTLFEMPHTAGESYTIKTQGGTAVACTKDKLMGLSAAGRIQWEIPLRLNNPIVSVADSYILAADRGGKDIYLINDGKLLLQTASSYSIINASVSSDGHFVVVSDEPYYKGLVTVKDAQDNEVFVWHSGNSYIIDAVLGTDTNKLALAAINTSLPSGEGTDGNLSSGMLLFNLYDTEPYQMHTLDGCVITNVFRAGKGFIVVTDKKSIGFGADGAQSWTYVYDGQTISQFSRGDGLTAFAMEDAGGRKRVVAIDDNGNEKCSISDVPNLSFISVEADRIAYNNGNDIIVCDSTGKQLYSIRTAKSFDDLLLFDSGKRAVGLTGTSLDILEIK